MTRKFAQSQSSVVRPPLRVGDLVTFDRVEELFVLPWTLAGARVVVDPGTVMIVTGLSCGGSITRVLVGERQWSPHPLEHPTFIRL